VHPISRRRALVLGGGSVLGAAGAFAVARGADAADGWRHLVVVTANIGRKHPGERERAIRDVRHAVRFGGRLAKPLVGWQEIGEGDHDSREPHWIGTYFGAGYRNLFLHDEAARLVPMSVPRDYTVLDRRVTRVHGGLAGVTPNRVITQALLQSADDPRLRFVFANTHYVAGAWNGRTDSHEAWRRRMWRRHFRMQRDDVLSYWHARGCPVIWTGDVNRSALPLFLPQHEKRAFRRGIDHIGWVPGGNGTELRLAGTRSVPMHVDDHDARVAVFQVRRV